MQDRKNIAPMLAALAALGASSNISDHIIISDGSASITSPPGSDDYAGLFRQQSHMRLPFRKPAPVLPIDKDLANRLKPTVGQQEQGRRAKRRNRYRAGKQWHTVDTVCQKCGHKTTQSAFVRSPSQVPMPLPTETCGCVL